MIWVEKYQIQSTREIILSKIYRLSLWCHCSLMSLSLGKQQIGGIEATGGHTVDRWKRKEAIKTIAGYVQALSPLGLAAVESLDKKNIEPTSLENTQHFETQLFLRSCERNAARLQICGTSQPLPNVITQLTLLLSDNYTKNNVFQFSKVNSSSIHKETLV